MDMIIAKNYPIVSSHLKISFIREVDKDVVKIDDVNLYGLINFYSIPDKRCFDHFINLNSDITFRTGMQWNTAEDNCIIRHEDFECVDRGILPSISTNYCNIFEWIKNINTDWITMEFKGLLGSAIVVTLYFPSAEDAIVFKLKFIG